MKRFAALLAILLLTTSTAFAADRGAPRTGPQVFTIVLDPDGPSRSAAREGALQYLVTRESAKRNVAYAFTSTAGREAYVARHAAALADTGTSSSMNKTCADARFNKVAYGTGTDWLLMYCGQTNPYLSDSWNDRISYVEASGSWTILYKCYNFNQYPYNPQGTCSTLAMQGGSIIYDLHPYGFNNITSSIKVCPEGFTFTDCQSF